MSTTASNKNNSADKNKTSCLKCTNKVYRHYSFCSIDCLNKWRKDMNLLPVDPHRLLIGIRNIGEIAFAKFPDFEGVPEQDAAYAHMVDPTSLKKEWLKWKEQQSKEEANV